MYQCGKSRTVAVCVFYRAELSAGGREVLGCSACWGRCRGGVRLQRVSLHLWAYLQLLVSSGLWCLSPCQQQTSAFWGLYLTLSWVREIEDFSDNSHMRSTWLVLCPGFAVAQQYWQVKIALLLNMLQWGNQKENLCLEQYEKTVKRFKEQKNASLKVFCRNHSLTMFVTFAVWFDKHKLCTWCLRKEKPYLKGIAGIFC